MGMIATDAAHEIVGHRNAGREIVSPRKAAREIASPRNAGREITSPRNAGREIVGHQNAFLPVEAPVGKETVTRARENRRRMHRPVVTTDHAPVHEIPLHAIIDRKDVLLLRSLLAHAEVESTERRPLEGWKLELAAMTPC